VGAREDGTVTLLLQAAFFMAVLVGVTAAMLQRAHVEALREEIVDHHLHLADLRGRVTALPRCAHPDAVPVESVVDGVVLARLCPDCNEQLPA
jgi:hypothetical protein